MKIQHSVREMCERHSQAVGVNKVLVMVLMQKLTFKWYFCKLEQTHGGKTMIGETCVQNRVARCAMWRCESP